MTTEVISGTDLGRLFYEQKIQDTQRQLHSLIPNSYEWCLIKEQQEDAELKIRQLLRRTSILNILGSHLVKNP